jgi:hypothetical protein
MKQNTEGINMIFQDGSKVKINIYNGSMAPEGNARLRYDIPVYGDSKGSDQGSSLSLGDLSLSSLSDIPVYGDSKGSDQGSSSDLSLSSLNSDDLTDFYGGSSVGRFGLKTGGDQSHSLYFSYVRKSLVVIGGKEFERDNSMAYDMLAQEYSPGKILTQSQCPI